MKTLLTISAGLAILFSCGEAIKVGNQPDKSDHSTITFNRSSDNDSEFKQYWNAGKAEITSYKLEQARYGEIHEGHSVLIYVTEPFNADKQVKADQFNKKNVPVLKLNSTKKFLTGIYPYSLMSSTFSPVNPDKRLIKAIFSGQEWCGHRYIQLNNREKLEIKSLSYFETESDQEFKLEKHFTENEIWNLIRIAPDKLPSGKLTMIPAFDFLALRHKDVKGYSVEASYKELNGLGLYQLHYPELNRTVKIEFKTNFPYEIERWEETFKSGFGSSTKMLTTKAEKMKRIRSDYWNKNSAKDIVLREELGI